MAQTAVSWLENELSKYDIHKPISLSNWDTLRQLLNQAKQKEKEQIIEAVMYGDIRGKLETYMTAEQYYNENYNK
jgi:hypothetical protein